MHKAHIQPYNQFSERIFYPYCLKKFTLILSREKSTAMCNSLLLSQFLRLLKSSYHKALSHVDSWIGDILSDLLPDFGLYN